METVACPSAHLCVVLEDEGVVTSANPLGGVAAWRATSGAGSWKLTRLRPRISFSALSCPTAKLCFGVDNGSVLCSRNPTKARSRRAGRIVSNAALESISCPTAHFCALTASASISAQILTSADPTGGSRAWHATHFSWERTNLGFSSVSCPSVRLCVAGDAWGDIFTSTHPARRGCQLTRLDGRVRAFDARELSCPSMRLCVSVSIAGIATSTRPAGGAKTWTIRSLSTPVDGVVTLGCVRSVCVAGDAGDNLLVSARPAPGVLAWGRFNLVQGHGSFESISCPSIDVCVAGDNAGNIVSSTNPGGGGTGWSVQPLPTGPSGAPYSVSSLSCPSQSLCAGVSGSAVLISTDPTGSAAAWSVATLSTLRAVSCPSVNLCIAGAGDGAIYTSTDPNGNAGAWSSTQLGEPPECGNYECTEDPIEAVACAPEQLCAATDGSNLWSSTDPGTPGATWTKSQMRLNSGVLTCPTENLCVSADREEIDATTDPSSPSPTWIATHLPTVTGTGDSGAPATGLVSSVSCPSTQLCVAVDDGAGYAFTGNPTDPNSWTATKIDSPLLGFLLGPRASQSPTTAQVCRPKQTPTGPGLPACATGSRRSAANSRSSPRLDKARPYTGSSRWRVVAATPERSKRQQRVARPRTA